MTYSHEVEHMCVVKKDLIMVQLQFLKKENGLNQKKSKTSLVWLTVLVGVLLSRVLASWHWTLKKVLSRKHWLKQSVALVWLTQLLWHLKSFREKPSWKHWTLTWFATLSIQLCVNCSCKLFTDVLSQLSLKAVWWSVLVWKTWVKVCVARGTVRYFGKRSSLPWNGWRVISKLSLLTRTTKSADTNSFTGQVHGWDQKGTDANEALKKVTGTYGRFTAEQGAVKHIDPRHE